MNKHDGHQGEMAPIFLRGNATFSIMKQYLILLCVALLFRLPVQATSPTCGVTIITHGYEFIGTQDTFPQWVRLMADAIKTRTGAAVPIYRVWYDGLSNQVSLLDGATSIDISQSGGAIILLDWSEVSFATTVTAQDIADRFYAYLFNQLWNGRNLAEIPIHLIGHSRGCSLNSRLAYNLAQGGVLIDQVTTLDPHPVRPFNLPPGNDWVPETFQNVLFADNYFEVGIGSIPDGMPIPGTFFEDLSSVLIGNWTISNAPHTRVHTYYHGTIDLSPLPLVIDGEQVNGNWYLNTDSRDVTGYNFSRYTNRLLARPASGVNQFIGGSGGTGTRTLINYSANQVWSNAQFDQRSSIPSSVTVGQSISIPYSFADRNSQQTITFFTDVDTNPFNGVQQSQIGSPIIQGSNANGGIGTGIFQWTPTAADVGTHFIGVKGANASGYARYDYFFKQVTVQPATTLAPTISDVSPRVLPASAIRQTITITGTGFTGSSTLVFNAGGSDIASIPADLHNDSATQLRYDFLGPVPASWTVKVVSGGVPSNAYPFSVIQTGAVLTGLSVTGPGTVNENTTGQFTAKAIFSDGTTPDVTASTTWGVSSGPATINSSTGLLSAQSVSANTGVTVTASYTSGSVTKAQTASTTIVDTGGGGGATTQELISNGDFEQGDNGIWHANTLPGGASGSAGILAGSYPNPPSKWYAYLGNHDNAVGSLFQFIDIPANATQVILNFSLNIVTNEQTVGSPPFDVMDVNLRTSSDVLIQKIRTYSEADKGTNTNGSYIAQSNIDLTPYIASYKGQRIILQFYAATNGPYLSGVSSSTIFRIDDVRVTATVQAPVTLTGLSISGPTQVQENQTAQYRATAIFSDGTTPDVTGSVTWGASGSASINSSSGLLSAPSVSANAAATVTASYTSGGVTQPAQYPITILDVSPPLVSLEITGPTIFNENTTQQFVATAYYGDGTSKVVTSSCNWSSDSAQVPVTSGSVTVGDLAADTIATFFADYTENSTTQSTRLSVKAQDIPVPVTLTSLSIAGPAAMNENSTAQYTATAHYSDGTSQGVVANWLDDSTATTVSIFGLLSAGEVAANTAVNVSASYTEGGVTRNASKPVTINDVPDTTGPALSIVSPLAGAIVTSASLVVSGSASDGGLGNHGISSVTVKVTAATGGTATGAGTANWSATIALAVGANTITVTAKDGANNATSKSVTVTRQASPNANLANLVPSAGYLVPAFSASIIGYYLYVPNPTTSVRLTPTVADSGAHVTVNGQAVNSGSPSQAIPLNLGGNLPAISVVVTAADGTPKTYSVTAVRGYLKNASLGYLILSRGALNPSFTPQTMAYSATLPNSVTLEAVTAASADPFDTVAIMFKANTVASGTGKASAAIPLATGANVITVMVTAEDGTTKLTYTVTVTRQPDFTGTYDGMATPVAGAANPGQDVGLGLVTISPGGGLTGKFKLGGSATPVAFTGLAGLKGIVGFGSTQPFASTVDLVRAGLPTLTLAMRVDVQFPLTSQITGELSQNSVVVANIVLNRRLYTSTVPAVAPLMNVPVSILDPATDQGDYTAILKSLTPAAQGLPASAFPQGHGWALVYVQPTGGVYLAGELADGQPFIYFNYLSKDNVLPFHVPLYSGTGSVSGQIHFGNVAGQSDADGVGLRWYKKANAADTAYVNGWPAGIDVDFFGSKLVARAITGKTMLGNNPAVSPTVNALIELSDGGLTGVLSNPLTLTSAGGVVMHAPLTVGTGTRSQSIALPASGALQGSFLYPVTNASATFKGVVFQKTTKAAGYFLATPSGATKQQSGAVTITAQ